MFGFARILSLLVALAIALAPLAPVAAQCADQAAASEMAAMPDMSCCPADDDSAEPMVCKVGCVQLAAVFSVDGNSSAVPVASYVAGQPAVHAGWLTPPDIDPPKANLRS